LVFVNSRRSTASLAGKLGLEVEKILSDKDKKNIKKLLDTRKKQLFEQTSFDKTLFFKS